MALNVSRLTLGEVAKIEELSGQSITSIGEDDAPKGKTLAAMAFVAKRREDASFTWNAAQNLTFDEANEILGLTDEDEQEQDADPTVPEDGSSPSSSGSRPKKHAGKPAPKE